MKIEFEQQKLEPETKVTTTLSAKCEEVESGFRIPISIIVPSVPDPVPITAIECEVLNCENGVLKLAIKSANYTAGELGEPILLNHVLVDLKQVFPATNEGEVNLVPVPVAKVKPMPTNS